MSKIYLSGPMSGIDGFNYPAFKKAAEKLRTDGHHVENPAEVQLDDGVAPTWQNFMRKDVKLIAECEIIALLPGWEKSRGSTLELHLATQLGLSVMQL